MLKLVIIATAGVIIGFLIGVYFFITQYVSQEKSELANHQQIIGFLPYWLLDRAKTNYSNEITTLAYFALKINGNSQIVKLSNPQQDDPGWYTLKSGKLDPYFASSRKNNIKLSLVLSSGDATVISQLISKPLQHSNNLISEIAPLMKLYHFQDLNLDIEDTSPASKKDQMNFSIFIKDIKHELQQKKLGTLTLEISPSDPIIPNLININMVSQYADFIVLMAYDYHSSVSYVTGPVAPLSGAGVDLEYDVTSAVEKTIQKAPPGKIILGMPLYGYEWETLSTALHSAVLPGSGVIASNNRMVNFLSACATCSAFFDTESQEEFAEYKDMSSDTYHQIFFPTIQSVNAKINLAKQKHLGGVALWALGYENNTMLYPLQQYK